MKLRWLLCGFLTVITFSEINAQAVRPRRIERLIGRSPMLNDHFTGFSLYDLGKRSFITGQNSDKYFTPASNTKLFTFYAGLKLLNDSITGLQYAERMDSLIFWGTGDPSFLRPDVKGNDIAGRLNSSGKKLYWATGRFTGNFYGVGWTYDDYNEYYQPEMSELPVYGNIIRFRESNGILHSTPMLGRDGLLIEVADTNNRSAFRIRREIMNNVFHQPIEDIPPRFSQDVPFKVNQELISHLLKQKLPLFSGPISYPKPADLKSLNSIPTDTLFRHMLLSSDNFIAEQILLNIAAEHSLEMNTKVVIDHVIKKFLLTLPDKPVWVDGSGLSRQNLFTPRSIVKLCEMIYDEIGDESRLFNLLPQGGKTGTLKNLYKGKEPFIFAKTGSLSNNHNLSGFLVTKSGRKLIFSFMNNSYVRPTAEIRSEMERILTHIYQNY